MKRRPDRTGAAWVNVLVVVVVLVVLAGLLLPAVNTGRHDYRRVHCLNSQRHVASAFINFDGAKGYLPGAAHVQSVKTSLESTDDAPNSTPIVERNSSFVFPLLPYLDRNDLFVYYSTGGPESGKPLPHHLKVMTCPYDETSVNNGAQISYVVNAGRQDFTMTNHRVVGTEVTPGAANLANGAVARHTFPWGGERTSLNYINGGDGASTTILLTENIDAADYNDGHESLSAVTWDLSAWRTFLSTGDLPPGYAINSRTGERSDVLRFPRPSSRHGRGALVAFADGHVDFLAENIAYPVYCQLMTSRSRSVTDDDNAPLGAINPGVENDNPY